MKDEENQTCETPLVDLMNSDLKHYNEASLASHHWSSGIPRAIEYYYIDRPEMEKKIEELKIHADTKTLNDKSTLKVFITLAGDDNIVFTVADEEGILVRNVTTVDNFLVGLKKLITQEIEQVKKPKSKRTVLSDMREQIKELEECLSEYVFNKRSLPDDTRHTARCLKALKQQNRG